MMFVFASWIVQFFSYWLVYFASNHVPGWLAAREIAVIWYYFMRDFSTGAM